MNPGYHKLAWLTVGSTLSLAGWGSSAQANSTGTAADLLPLNAQGMAVEAIPTHLKGAPAQISATAQPEIHYQPALLRSVANTVNASAQSQDSSEDDIPDISDFVDLSFIEQFIDEDGNIDLPLGLTVYEAMGRTSIGFGGDF